MNKNILILGGTGYIGSQIVGQVLEKGYHVFFTYHKNHDKNKELLDKYPQVKSFSCDLCSKEAIEDLILATMDTFAQLHGIIQCAGSAGRAEIYNAANTDKVQEINDQDFSDMMQLTTNSTFTIIRRLLPLLQKAQIVLIGSMDGVKSVPAPIHYGTAKGALCALTTALAKELGPRGHLINLLAVGILEGGIGKLLSEDLRQKYLKYNCLQRLGTREDVANWVLWLLQNNTYIHGQSICLDGGL